MKTGVSIFILVLGLLSPCRAAEPEGKCIFYIKIVAETKNGLWRPGDTRIGDQLSLFETKNGMVVVHRREGDHSLAGTAGPSDLTFGLGEQNSAILREAFQAANLHGFDFERQLAGAKVSQHALEPRIGYGGVIGGKTVELYANWEGSNFKFTCKDLGATLTFYSRFNAELGRLRTLLDQIGMFEARRYTFTDF